MFQRLLDNSLISFELEEVRYEEVGSLSRTHSSSNWNLDCGSASYSTASRSKISSGSVVLRMPKIEIGRVQKLGA